MNETKQIPEDRFLFSVNGLNILFLITLFLVVIKCIIACW